MVAPFWSDVRSQHLQKMTSNGNEIKISAAEKKINQELVIVSTSFGIGILSILYPPLVVLSKLGFIYGCIPNAKGAYNSLFKAKRINVDVLTIITSPMFMLHGNHILGNFSNLTSSLSRKLLMKVQDNSTNSFIEVFKQPPKLVYVLKNGIEVEKSFQALDTDDIVIVTAGQTIPADGSIINGVASIDQQSLTGEAQPVEKGIGLHVFALTIVIAGKIYIKVEKTGEKTTAAQIGNILNKTADFKSTTQVEAEVIADKTIIPLMSLSLLSYPLLGLNSAATVMNSHPKYRMTVVAPIGMLNYLNIAFQNGILIKDGRTLELLNKVDTIIFDKTGTLTHAQPHIHKIHSFNGYEENELLTYVAAVEYKQSHPIALAILKKAESRDLKLPEIDEAKYKIGYGIEARIANKLIRVGSIRFMEMEAIPIPDKTKELQEFCHSQRHSLIIIAIDSDIVGAIEFHSNVRQEAKQIVKQFRQRNIKSMYIISGDQEAPTKALAQTLGIEHYFAEVLPEDKANIIKKLQEEGKFVCYVGDGINDSIALKRANVSISLRGASSVAIDTAQVVLMDESLKELVPLFELSDKFLSNQHSNFVHLFAPSFVGIIGAFFFHFSFYHSAILNQVGFITGLSNSMLPWWKQNKQSMSKISNSNRQN